MRAVRGTVTSSKPISLSKAAATLSDFAQSGVCSRPEISAYLRRASSAFDELVGLHREIRAARKQDRHCMPQENDESRSRKKRKRGEGEAGDREGTPVANNANSWEKNRILASGAKLVEDAGVPGLKAAIGERKISASTFLTGEKIVEDLNAIRSDGKYKKQRRKKEKIGESKDAKIIDFQMDDKKNVEVIKGHEKEEKKKKNKEKKKGAVNCDAKKGIEVATMHRDAGEKKTME